MNQQLNIGALENRLEHTLNYLSNGAFNLSSSYSRIKDADMARELINYFREKVLMEIGGSILSQGQFMSQNVLQLLDSL